MGKHLNFLSEEGFWQSEEGEGPGPQEKDEASVQGEDFLDLHKATAGFPLARPGLPSGATGAPG